MATAIIFPGQGSQQPAIGRAWLDHPAWATAVAAEADSGRPLTHLLVDADADELGDTVSAQLSVLTASLVAWRALEPLLGEGEVVAVAGHSLGQITALVAAGVLDAATGVRLATARADASAAAQAARPGGLVALLGADAATAEAVCARAGAAWPANLNGPGQVVVGAAVDHLDAVTAAAEASGVRRVRRLDVDGAFHTPLMAPAAERFAETLATVDFTAPAVPVVTNHDARPVATADGWPERLTRHLVEPVRWADVVATLAALGADTVIEVGPGGRLAGLVRRIDPDLTVATVAVPDDLPVPAAAR